MFSHIRNNNGVANAQIDALKKENDSILKRLETIDKSISALDAKIVQSEDIILKLLEVEKKFEKITDIEKKQYDQDRDIGMLKSKVIEMETKLIEKDVRINELVDKLQKDIPADNKPSENNSQTMINKKNILERLQEVEKINDEKNYKIEDLTIQLDKLECEMKKQCLEAFEVMTELVAECEDNEKFDELTSFSCPECDFVGKHLRGSTLETETN